MRCLDTIGSPARYSLLYDIEAENILLQETIRRLTNTNIKGIRSVLSYTQYIEYIDQSTEK